jgi:dipeptidyl aminopeptidase/acylaminoacyl peptidase
MTAVDRFDRYEQRLPELMNELAPARVPDYFDDLLRVTAGAHQRPAWTSLERWLPMQLTASSAWARRPAARPVVLVLLAAAILVALGVALAIGSKPKLPPLFGPAGNGLVVYSDQTSGSGDIYALDPVSGARTLLVGGAGDDVGPLVSPDGQRILFARLTDVETFYTAKVDGSDVRLLIEGSVALPVVWSSDGTRILAVPEARGDPIIVEVATGARTVLDVSTPVTNAAWLSDGRILLTSDIGGVVRFAVVGPDGTGETRLATPNAGPAWALDPAGARLAWVEWDNPSDGDRVLHVLTIATGIDEVVTANPAPGESFVTPEFTPDGRFLTAVRRFNGTSQLALVAADGSGQPLLVGPVLSSSDADITPLFAPDGRSLFVAYDDGSVWQFSVPEGLGERVSWPNIGGGVSWQRVAD